MSEKETIEREEFENLIKGKIETSKTKKTLAKREKLIKVKIKKV